MKAKTAIAFSMILLIFMLFTSTVFIPTVSAAPNAASWCSCLLYYQNNQGLPHTGNADFAAYKYGYLFLPYYQGPYSPKGYNVTYITPSTTGLGPMLLVWKAIVFYPGAFGADNTYGHIGIVTSAIYNSSTRLWTIQYKDAQGWTYWANKNKNISLVQNLSESGCTNVAIRKLVTSDLTGLRFFKWSKK
jgi:hypothetical protein